MCNFILKNNIFALIAVVLLHNNCTNFEPNFTTDYGISFYFDNKLALSQNEVEGWTHEVITFWAERGLNKNDIIWDIRGVIVSIEDVDKFVINNKEYRSYIYPYSNRIFIASRPPLSSSGSVWINATSLQIVKSSFYHELSIYILGDVGKMWDNEELIYLYLEKAGW